MAANIFVNFAPAILVRRRPVLVMEGTASAAGASPGGGGGKGGPGKKR